MNHSETRKLLDDYLDHELDRQRAAQVEAHLMQCANCREELEYLRGLTRLAGQLPRNQKPGRDLWAGIEAAIGDNKAPATSNHSEVWPSASRDIHNRTRRRLTIRWKPAFAAVAVAASIALIIGLGGGFDSRQPAAPSLTATTTAQPDWGARGGIVAPAAMSTEQAITAEFAQTAARFAEICSAPDTGNCEAVTEIFGGDLELIDRAIAEARDALADNPYSQQAMSSLITALKTREAIQLKALRLIENSYHTT